MILRARLQADLPPVETSSRTSAAGFPNPSCRTATYNNESKILTSAWPKIGQENRYSSDFPRLRAHLSSPR